MLIEKSQEYAVGEVVSLLMHNGQEIFGKFVSKDSDGSVTLSKPRVPLADAEGKLYDIVPIMNTAVPDDGAVVFTKDRFICSGKTIEILSKAYEQVLLPKSTLIS